MSPPWSKPLDIDRLADGESDVAFAVPLAELPRLRSQVVGVAGEVHGSVHFARESGFVIADLTLKGEAVLVCQRCLAPMTEPVESTSRAALILNEADTTRVPEHLEPVLAPGGRISVGELVEEELLLALPLVPLHAREADCNVSSGEPVKGERPEHTTQKPFQQLGELLKRS